MPVEPGTEALVVGAGIGGLSAALALAARGVAVRVLEAADHPGGKAGVIEVDGVMIETGPSVLTLPGVFARVFARAGRRLEDVIGLRRLDPGFRYRYADGVVVDVGHDPEDTLAHVRTALGPVAEDELASFLRYSRRIWEAAAPHFVLGPAPTWAAMASLALRHPRALLSVDPLHSMAAGIDRHVSEPHLRMLLRRYATYNGSDPRQFGQLFGGALRVAARHHYLSLWILAIRAANEGPCCPVRLGRHAASIHDHEIGV